MKLLSHPFGLLPNGVAATVMQGSDASNSQLIAAVILTRPGERELCPGFGVTDPTMTGLNPTEVAVQVAQYGPNVTIVDVRQGYVSPTTSTAVVEFQ